MNLVVFKFNNLGDNVVFVPAIQALRQRCPGLRITLLTTPNEAGLYGGKWAPDEVLVSGKLEFEKAYRRPWALVRWLLAVRRRHAGLCMVPFDQGNTAHLLARLSGAETRVGASMAFARIPGSLTEIVALPECARPAMWNWNMARAVARSLGDATGWPEEPPPPDLRHLLAPQPRPRGARKRVVVHAGAGGPLNQWQAGNFAAVAESLSREFEVVWIAHGKNSGTAPAGVTHAPVNSVAELADWISASDLFLGNNSGPMHLANALGCPGVVVTGPSARGWDPFWHRERWSVLRHPNLSCSPCERLQEKLAGCANLAAPMACMTHWTPERVAQECRLRLAG